MWYKTIDKEYNIIREDGRNLRGQLRFHFPMYGFEIKYTGLNVDALQYIVCPICESVAQI